MKAMKKKLQKAKPAKPSSVREPPLPAMQKAKPAKPSAIKELLRPTKMKFALTLILAIASYVLLVSTKEVYEVPSLQLVITGGDNPHLSPVSNLAVQFNSLVMVFFFPVSSLLMLLVMGGIPNNLVCQSSPCELATGTSWLYLAAALINIPYYYLLASFFATAYKKVWKGE